MRFLRTLLLILPAVAAVPLQPTNQGEVTGFGQLPKVVGAPALGERQLYESNLFVSASGGQAANVVGPSRRLGAPPGQGPRGDGFFDVPNLDADTYSLYVAQPNFFIRPKVIPSVIVSSGVVSQNVTLAPDYGLELRNDQQWTGPDSCWLQTFRAVGTSVTHVSFILAGVAGKGKAQGSVQFLKDDGSSNVTTWPAVAPARVGYLGIATETDNWVKFRSGEVALTPGATYALKVCAPELQPYKRDKDASSYPHGRAYTSNGTAQDLDLAFTVFTDNDGTRLTLLKRTPGTGELVDDNWSTRFAQTFVAAGCGLAGVDVWAAGAAGQWNITMEWSVHEDTPSGKQLGTSKITQAAFQAAGVGLHGVSFNPSEVSLSAGQTYAIVFKVVDPPPTSDGFNVMVSDDPYPDGHGVWWNDKEAVWVDKSLTVASTVMEYTC